MNETEEEYLQTEEPRGTIRTYLQLTKIRIVAMVLNACLIGILLAGGQIASMLTLWTLLATALLSGGSAALNHYIDREADANSEFHFVPGCHHPVDVCDDRSCWLLDQHVASLSKSLTRVLGMHLDRRRDDC